MNPVKGGLFCALAIVALWLLLFLYKSYLDKDLCAHDADYADAKAHREECVKLRVAFIKVCLEEHRGITQCQIDWSQVRGQSYDSPLDVPWANQVDCSK